MNVSFIVLPFIQQLYNELSYGETLGNAVQFARKICKRTDSQNLNGQPGGI
jgi:hypothetical protein